MNIIELKEKVENSIKYALEIGENPKQINVSIQIDLDSNNSFWTDDIELAYDGDCQASGCVLHGWFER